MERKRRKRGEPKSAGAQDTRTPVGSNGKANGFARKGSVPAPRRGGIGNGKAPKEPDFRVVVIGASAGGVEALCRVVRSLPGSFPAAVFVVLHISPAGPSLLPDILGRCSLLPVVLARDGAPIKPGTIYVAAPDHHLVLKHGTVAVTRGPRENNARPAVDPLFRTAARTYGPWTIGVVLSGGLDDGTLGLMDIKRFGGVAIVQDPEEAMFPGMPTSAMENVAVDHVLTLDEIGPVLAHLAREPVPAAEGADFMARKKRATGPDISEFGNEELQTRNLTTPPSPFTCPECGGALWELENGKLLRYRCHVGHGFTAESLMAAQGQRLEDALWTALRALEETAEMRRRMAERARKGGWEIMARNYADQADYARSRAGLIRSVLVVDDPNKISEAFSDGVEENAIESRDPDAGKAAVLQPRAPEPPELALPPLTESAGAPLAAPAKGRKPGGDGAKRRQKTKPD